MALATCLGIAVLFWLDRDDVPVTNWVWLPSIWLLIASSRPLSSWATFSAPEGPYDQYVNGSPLDRNILSLFLGLAVLVLYKRSAKVVSILRTNAPLILFFSFCAVSAFWSDYPLVVLKRWVRTLGDIAMILVILTEPNWAEALKRVLMRVGYVLIPLSILFIRFFPALGRSYSVGGAPMWTGVATDKNALGALCMLFGVSLLWRGLSTYSQRTSRFRRRRLITISGLFVMVLYLLFIVDSKTALSCFLMASILIAVTLVPMFRRRGFVSLTVAAMLAVCYSVLFLGMGSSALETMGRDASLTGRSQVWQTVLPFAVNPWVGAGYENFWIGERLNRIVATLGTGLNQAHNGYIELYLNIGWVGLSLLAIVIVAGYRNILRGLRTDPEMARLKLAFFFICLVYNFTEAAFKMMSPVWITFMWAVMATPKPRAKLALSPTYRSERATARWSELGDSESWQAPA